MTLAIKAINLRPRLTPEQWLASVVMSWRAVLGSGLPGLEAKCLEHRALACIAVCFLLVHWSQGLAAIVLRFQDFSLTSLLGDETHDVSDAKV